MEQLISVKDFSPEELRKWQLKLLEVLVYFRDFCEAHNLRFFLAAGTCIGAVRHHGFIPWDDDLDVQMPRDDYDKLVDLWDKYADKSRFRVERTNKERCVGFPMTVCRSRDTTCIFDHSVDADICQGLKIDVEFLDGVPSGKWNRKFTLQCARLMALLRSERVPIHGIPKVQKQSRLILKLLPTHWIRWKVSTLLEKKIKQCKFDSNCEFIRYISAPMRKKRLYESAVYLDFEGYKMPVPVGYDEYLRDQYGDYMKLPPESQRKPITDNLVFYDLDHSYLDYKGKYYCVDKKNKPQQ